MFDMPEHLKIGLTKDGKGPADNTPDFDHWGCWCGDDNCQEWKKQ